MNFKRSVVILTFFALLMIPTNLHAEDSRNTSRNALEDSLLLEKSIEFRAKYGLNNSNSLLKELQNEYSVSKTYGVYLSVEEESEIEKRFAFQEEVNPQILNFLNKIDFRDFGILYIDQANKGVYNIGLTDPNMRELISSELELIVGNDLIRYYDAEFSEHELEEQHERIYNDINVLASQGIVIDTIVTDVINEKVDVYINSLDTSNTLRTMNMIMSKYDTAMVNIKPSSIGNIDDNRASTYSTLEAGLRITNNSDSSICTLGFTAQWGNAKYIITAAHCGSQSNGFNQGTNSIGTMIKRHYDGRVDAAVIGINSKLTYSNYVYTSVSQGSTFTSWQSYNDDIVGENVCISGITSSYNCGNLTSRSVSGQWGNPSVSFTGLRSADYVAAGGDSGGPTFYNKKLKGIHKGRTAANVPVYSHVQWVIELLSTPSSTIQPIIN